MSKIINALKQAEEERATAHQVNTPKKFSTYFQTLKQELQEEIRWMEQAVTRRVPQPPPASPPLPTGEQTPPGGADSARATHSPAGPSDAEGASKQGQTNDSASWEQALALVDQHVRVCEQEAARQAENEARLKAQLTALNERLAQLEQERLMVRQRLEHAAKTAAVLEEAKMSLSKQVAVSRGCQILARDVRAAAEEFQAEATAVVRLAQATPRVPDEVAHYQRLTDALQRASQLRFRLTRALTSTDRSGAESTGPAVVGGNR